MTTAVRTKVPRGEAPFLVWPVARREFYASICVALIAPLGWGMLVFGWRVLVTTVAALAAAFIVHTLLRRFTERGKVLVASHTLLLTMLLVTLSHPQWPAWVVAAAAAVSPAISWALGGPGRERIHPTLAVAILMCFVVTPAPEHARPGATGPSVVADAIVARNRLFMGDIRNHREATLYRWPRSRDLEGDDAVVMPRPDETVRDVLNRVSDELRTANLTAEGGVAPGFTTMGRIHKTIEDALVMRLSSMEQLLAGGFPGQVGTVCFIGCLVGGLYLAYRNILRFRSAAVFIAMYMLVHLAVLLNWDAVSHLGFWGLWHVGREFAGEFVTLWSYSVVSGDVFFAAVFVLALPGTEPLSRPGRRMFLMVAATTAAWLHRQGLPAPAATTTLTLMMPFRGLFDMMFHRRSWLDH